MVSNPQFPHTCIIYNTQTTGEYPDEVTSDVTIMQSECNNQVGNGGDTTLKNDLYQSDFTCYLPKHDYQIKTGDKIKVLDDVRLILGTIKASYVGNIGAQIWYNEDSELNASITAEVFPQTYDKSFK